MIEGGRGGVSVASPQQKQQVPQDEDDDYETTMNLCPGSQEDKGWD